MGMVRQSGRCCQGSAIALVLLAALSGCSSGPGSRLSLATGSHRLTYTAEELREMSGPPPGIARELDKQMDVPYIIEPGDVLLVQPASLDSPLRLPGDQVVLPDGSIQLGQFGHLLVAGKPLVAIEGDVNAVVKARMPEAGTVIVRLVTRDSKVFYVLGEVNAPGAFPLRGRETVLDAIVAAGGLSSNASRQRIILTRPTGPKSCRIVLPVEYNHIVQVGDTTTNYQIRAGDRVFVPTKQLREELCALKRDKKTCIPQTTCLPRDGTPLVSLSKPEPMPEVPAAPSNPPAIMGLPVPQGAPVPPMPPASEPSPQTADDPPPIPVWTPPPGYKTLAPPGG